MNPLRWARLRLRAVVARRAIEQDMQDEMREHLERATERYMERGMGEAEARLAARREFGNVTMLQAESRDARGGRWVDALAGDLRFALRYFARHKATTAIVVAVLALGTGANTLIFSVFQAHFLRPPPAVPRDAAHARVWSEERPTQLAAWQPRRFTRPEVAALAARRDVFRDVAAWVESDVILRPAGGSARGVAAQFVTPGFFAVVGVPLAAGPGFRQVEDGTPDPSVVMAHGMAEQLYGSAAAAIGKRVLVNERPAQVVGVAPPRFQGAARSMDDATVWVPLGARADVSHLPARWEADSAHLDVLARLAPGATREQAAAIAGQVVAAALPDSAARVGMARRAEVRAMHALPPGRDANEMILAITLIVAIGVVILLVGWMNVSALMVAAAVARRHEIAVRLSLGASRLRLVRQLVTESVVLSLAGGAIGLALAWGQMSYMMATEIDGVDLTPDAGTFAFALLVSVGAGVLFGLSPALHATRAAVSRALRDSGTGASSRAGLQRAFVVAQIALSQPLLVVLGVMLSMVLADYRPLAPALGGRVVALGLRPLATGAPGQRPADVEALAARLAARPEVAAVAPEAAAFAVRGIVAPDRLTSAADTAPTIVRLEGAAPGWFALQDVPIVMGRDVALADTAAADIPVVVGSRFARRLWGETNPVGRRLASPALAGWQQDSLAMTVVGVFDEEVRTTRGALETRLYTARGKAWRRDLLLVRTHAAAEPWLPALRRIVRAEAPSLPVTSMETLAQSDAREHAAALRMAATAGAGGVVALLLASLGLYGVVSLAVRQRTREIGIRIAVGAHPMRVARMFLASGVRVGLVALALGLPLSVAGLKAGLERGVLVAPQVDPLLIGAVIAVVLLGVAAGATWVPARRAARVDPARTLRTE